MAPTAISFGDFVRAANRLGIHDAHTLGLVADLLGVRAAAAAASARPADVTTDQPDAPRIEPMPPSTPTRLDDRPAPAAPLVEKPRAARSGRDARAPPRGTGRAASAAQRTAAGGAPACARRAARSA